LEKCRYKNYLRGRWTGRTGHWGRRGDIDGEGIEEIEGGAKDIWKEAEVEETRIEERKGGRKLPRRRRGKYPKTKTKVKLLVKHSIWKINISRTMKKMSQ